VYVDDQPISKKPPGAICDFSGLARASMVIKGMHLVYFVLPLHGAPALRKEVLQLPGEMLETPQQYGLKFTEECKREVMLYEVLEWLAETRDETERTKVLLKLASWMKTGHGS
jgi:hypothetical protein